MNSVSANFSPMDPQTFSDESKIVIDFVAEYYRNIEKYPVLSVVNPGYLSKTLPDAAPDDSESLENILKDISKYILPGLTHW